MSGKSAFRSLDINCGDTDVVGSGGQLAAKTRNSLFSRRFDFVHAI